MRSAYPPVQINPGVAPEVKTVTGIQGAHIDGAADASQGHVVCVVGPTPSLSGTIVLQFPSAPPTLFVASSQVSTIVSTSTVNVTIAWTAIAPLVPGTKFLIAYEWAVTQ